MSEIVRVALNQTSGKINWPSRCPRCGTQKDLINIEGRVLRETSSYRIVSVVFRRETTSFHFPVCRQHSFQNEIGMKLLERSFSMTAIRGLIYISLVFIISLLYSRFYEHRPMTSFIQGYQESKVVTTLFLLAGPVGVFLLLWARKVASVCPIKIDGSVDVVSIRFKNKEYARDFRQANLKATHRFNTVTPIFFLRPWFWMMVIFVCLFLFLLRSK
ncbi:hypothetical protein ACO0K9_22360 [Undibacterium sp. Ji50W]|uniref:hypothetical protein n=1 Tax=Undibacterium sp. Ji50W TaxID=3413041 RepID=UPI003BEF7AEF